MATNNGKYSRKNGNGKSATSTASTSPDDLQNLPTVEKILTLSEEQPAANITELQEPDKVIPQNLETSNQVQLPQEQPIETIQSNPEDLLKQARTHSQQVQDEAVTDNRQAVQEGQESSELATASSQINNALLQAGQNLVEASTEADQELFAAGLEDAIASGDIMTQGYQAGLLIRYGKGKLTSAQSLREQMNVLRSHTDANNNNAVTDALKQLGLDTNPTEADEKKSPKSTPFGQISQAMSNSRNKEGINLFQNQKQQ
ncbi:MAG: hypothetical protein KME49_22790 [Brasilonema octagenarum HA4186-MV1]|jgi:hypothetical protein|nr:hypothetical protein [Brasilonema octagenarum HA4186-MV1]